MHLWKQRDPIGRLRESLEREGAIPEGDFERKAIEIRDRVEEAWARADSAPYPDISNLLGMVYEQENS